MLQELGVSSARKQTQAWVTRAPAQLRAHHPGRGGGYDRQCLRYLDLIAEDLMRFEIDEDPEHMWQLVRLV